VLVSAFYANKLFIFVPTYIKFYFYLTSTCLHVFRLNKMEISQGFKLCYKKCCSYMLPNLSKNVAMHTKVIFLHALLLCCRPEMLKQDYAFILFMSTFHFSGGQVVVPEKFLECVIQGLYFHAQILFFLGSLFASTSHHI
jgi:hypothetical protein